MLQIGTVVTIDPHARHARRTLRDTVASDGRCAVTRTRRARYPVPADERTMNGGCECVDLRSSPSVSPSMHGISRNANWAPRGERAVGCSSRGCFRSMTVLLPR